MIKRLHEKLHLLADPLRPNYECIFSQTFISIYWDTMVFDFVVGDFILIVVSNQTPYALERTHFYLLVAIGSLA